MIPILYEKNTRVFSGGGICRLSEALKWTVKEVLNGEFELEMSYPAAGENFQEIMTDRVIFAKPNPFERPQAFTIYAVTKPLQGKVKIYAEHVSHKMLKITVAPFHAKNIKEALTAVDNAVVGTNPFRIETALDEVNEINSNIPRSLRNAIYGRIMSLYGGEIKFDNYYAEIVGRRGSNKGFSIRYGKNLLDFNQKEDVSRIYDSVYPYYFAQDPEDEEDFEYVELPEKIIKIGETAERTMPLDLTGEFQEEPDEDELREAAERYIEEHDINKGSFSVNINFAILSQTEEYKDRIPPEQVELGDDVSIYIPQRGVTVKSRIVKTIYDGKRDRYESVTVGEIERDIVDSIAGVQGGLAENQEKIAMAKKTLAKVQTIAKDSEAQVKIIAERIDENETIMWNSIASIGVVARDNSANITLLAERATEAEKSIARIEQNVDEERARIDIIAGFQTETEINLAELSLCVDETSAKIGLIVGTDASGDYIKGGVIAEAINGQTEVKIKADVLNIDIVKTINASADRVQLISNEMLIETDGFKIENGYFTATGGTIGGWSAGYDGELQDYVMRSKYCIYGTVSWGDGTYNTVDGYIFTVLKNTGIIYIVKESRFYSSETKAKIPLLKAPVFSNLLYDENGDGIFESESSRPI